jgi:hypothetical protein
MITSVIWGPGQIIKYEAENWEATDRNYYFVIIISYTNLKRSSTLRHVCAHLENELDCIFFFEIIIIINGWV